MAEPFDAQGPTRASTVDTRQLDVELRDARRVDQSSLAVAFELRMGFDVEVRDGIERRGVVDRGRIAQADGDEWTRRARLQARRRDFAKQHGFRHQRRRCPVGCLVRCADANPQLRARRRGSELDDRALDRLSELIIIGGRLGGR